MAADYKRRHITWGKIVTPFVCLCVWHVVNSAIEMPQLAGLSSLCTTRDELPTQANVPNSHTSNASLTNKYEAVNQSNLQLTVGVTADTRQEIFRDFLAIHMQNSDWTIDKHETWLRPAPDASRQTDGRFAGLWIIAMVMIVLLDEVQMFVVSQVVQSWTCIRLHQVIPSCKQGWPTKWIGRYAKGLIVFGAVVSVVQSKELDGRQMLFMQLWNMQKPRKPLQSAQTPDMYQHVKGCDTYLWAPSQAIGLKQKFTLGDGNCWWRAVAHGQSQKWYTIKRRVLHHALTKMDLADSQIASIKEMRKANVWANEVAAHATAHYMRRTVVVVSEQQIIMIRPRDNAAVLEHKVPIFVAHSHNHFSYIHRRQAQQILEQHASKFPRRFADYRISVHDGHEPPLIKRSTTRSIPLHARCGKAQADKAIVALMRRLVFPTRHVPSDNLPSCVPASSSHCEPDDDWNDADDDEGDRRYGRIYRQFASSTQGWARDCCQYGVVLGYIAVLQLCRLLGGSYDPIRRGYTCTCDHPNPFFVNPLPAVSSPTCKEPETRSAKFAGTACDSLASATRTTVMQPANEQKHSQQIPQTQHDSRTAKAFSRIGISLSLGIIGFILGWTAFSWSNFPLQTCFYTRCKESPLNVEVLSPFDGARSDPFLWVSSRISNNPCEPRNVDGSWETRSDEACGGAAWDVVRPDSSHYLWGGAIGRLGLLYCSGMVCADTRTDARVCHEMRFHLENVNVHAWTGTDASCSSDLNNSPATTCFSISKFSEELGIGQRNNALSTWKGTFEHNFELQVFVENKQATAHTSHTDFHELICHKFYQHHFSNFRSHNRAGAQMALAEQIRRVAQADSYALPRAWRGRTETRGNIVPQILERPAAKARLAQPRPSRSPDLDLASAVSVEAAEAPPSPEPVEIVELLDDDPGTQEQRVHLVSIGSRWNNNPDVQVSGHLVECDLRDVDDPGRNRALQAHLGYHPDTMSRMIASMDFMQPVFDALFEALQHQRSTIRFTCASGRHRSVAAVHLAQAVLRGIVSNSSISIQHVSRHRWGNLCNLRCAECYNFVHSPPAPYLRAVAEIREDLLKALRGYMDRCDACLLNLQDTSCRDLQTCSPCRICKACAGTISDPSTSPSTCAMEKIKMFEILFATNLSLLQQAEQQISTSQPSKCTTVRWCSNLVCPFPCRDKTLLGIRVFNFWCKPPSYIVIIPACPLRKCEMVPPSYWDMLFKHLCNWPSLGNGSCSCIRVYDCLWTERYKPQGGCQHLLASSCCGPCPMQPRRDQNMVAKPHGRDFGTRGIDRGHCERVGFHNLFFMYLFCFWDGVHTKQNDPTCMSTIVPAMHVDAPPSVNALCQPISLKEHLTTPCGSFNLLCTSHDGFGNSLGNCTVYDTQAIQAFAFQHIQFLQHFCKHLGGKQSYSEQCLLLGTLCLGISQAMSAERLSEALQRVAKAKTSPLVPKAFGAIQSGPIVPKLIPLRCPPKSPSDRPTRPLEDTVEEMPVAKPKLAPAAVVVKSSGRIWPPPTPPRAPRPSSSTACSAGDTDPPVAKVPTAAVSPKPSAVPPMLPGNLNLEEDEDPTGDSAPEVVTESSSIPKAGARDPAASPKPSAAPPALPRTINLEEDEVPRGSTESVIEIPDQPDYRILLISEGVRFRDNRTFPFQGHEVWCDLRDVENPERDRRLQAHLGYHPLNIQNLMVNEVFMRKLFDAMLEALVNKVSKIRFVCHSGRHRSVAATHLAHLIMAGIVGDDNISVQHASSKHWHNLCQLQCDQCWNFVHNPPVEFHRALAEIRRDLQQHCQPYMTLSCDACEAVCWNLRWDICSQSTCDNAPICLEQFCVTGAASSGIADPASRARSDAAGNNRQHQYDSLFVKNLPTEQICSNTAPAMQHNVTNFNEHSFQQLPSRVPKFRGGRHQFGFVFFGAFAVGVPAVSRYEHLGGLSDSPFKFDGDFVVDLSVVATLLYHTGHNLTCLPSHLPTGKEQRGNIAVALDDVQLRSLLDTSSRTSVLVQVLTQFQGGHNDGDSTQVRNESMSRVANHYDTIPDPVQQFDDVGSVNHDPILICDDDAAPANGESSCPPTVIDEGDSQQSQDCKCSARRDNNSNLSFSRKRSAQQAFADDISQELNVALQYEYAPSSHSRGEQDISTNEIASLQQCIYDGYHFPDQQQQLLVFHQQPGQPPCPLLQPGDDIILGYLNAANLEFHNMGFPDSNEVLDIWEANSDGGFVLAVQPNQLLVHAPFDSLSDTPITPDQRIWEEWTINSRGDFVFCALSQRTDDTEPFSVQVPHPYINPPNEVEWDARNFWDEWEQDSDGHLHQRSPVSCNNYSFPSHRHESDHSMWDLDPYELLSSAHYTSALMSEPSSHPSLLDLQMIDWAFEESIRERHNQFQGGGKDPGKDEFQPTSKDVGRMVQKLKHVPHGLQNKQIRMLLTSNLTLMKKIERTTDAQHLLSCITAAAKRVGMLMTAPASDLPGKGSSTSGKGKDSSSSPNYSNDQDSFAANLPAQSAKDKGKGQGLPSNAKDKGKGRGPDKGHGKQNFHIKPEGDRSKGKGKNKTKTESFPKERPQATMKLVPDGWSVFPQQEFQANFGAVYMLDKPELIKQYAEKASGKSFPIGILAPKPYPIGVTEPQMLYKVEKQFGNQQQVVSIQAFLHQLTYTPVEYKACAPCVEIQKSESSKTQVLYVTFTDEEASTQTKLDLRQLKNYAARQWLSGIVLKRNPRADLEILDMWNLQSVDSRDADTTYQASIRVKQQHARRILALSAPGALQVNCPGAMRQQMDHVWLKDAGVPWETCKVQEYLNKFKTDHLGAFCLRGT